MRITSWHGGLISVGSLLVITEFEAQTYFVTRAVKFGKFMKLIVGEFSLDIGHCVASMKIRSFVSKGEVVSVLN